MSDVMHTPWTVAAGDASYVRVPGVVKPINCGSVERAALIVRAVNAYDDLVKALEHERAYWAARVYQWKDMVPDHPGVIQANEHFDRISAALKRDKGE